MFIKISKLLLATVLLLQVAMVGSAQLTNDAPKVVKVAVVIQDPRIPSKGNKRLHELYKTWTDPWKLALAYRDTLFSISGGTVDYKIVRVYEDSMMFTRLNSTNEMISFSKMYQYLQEPGWKTLQQTGTHFDYNAFLDYYKFGQMRDKGEIDEVWLWTFPYVGTWESTFAGKNAFWLNSDPVKNPPCKELLTIMGLNYERDLGCALESYGHRVESIMRHVYGRWECKSPDRNNWEIFTSIEKDLPGMAHVGNIHFPPNGTHDYEWINKDPVKTYADNWKNYPTVSGGIPRVVNCSEWSCGHVGYMCWWFSHLPHFEGINKTDKHLNNWWYYVIDYNAAMKKEAALNNKNK